MVVVIVEDVMKVNFDSTCTIDKESRHVGVLLIATDQLLVSNLNGHGHKHVLIRVKEKVHSSHRSLDVLQVQSKRAELKTLARVQFSISTCAHLFSTATRLIIECEN